MTFECPCHSFGEKSDHKSETRTELHDTCKYQGFVDTVLNLKLPGMQLSITPGKIVLCFVLNFTKSYSSF